MLSAAAYAGMFVFGLVMALLGALLPLLSATLKFDLGRAGDLFLTMNAAMLAASLASGPVLDRFGHKPPLAAGALLVALALAEIAAASSYGALAASVALLGLGGGALNSSTNTLVADLHEDAARKSAALNLLGVFFGFGALALPFGIGALVEGLGVATILKIAGALCAGVALVALPLRFPGPKHRHGLPLGEAAQLARHPLALLFGLLLFFESGNEFILGGYTSSYLKEMGAPVTAASYWLAGFWAAIMAARVVSSRVLLRIGSPAVVAASAAASAAAVVLLLAAPTKSIAGAAVVLLGLALSSIFPTVLGQAGACFAERSGTAFGVLFAMALTGGMTLPWAVGRLAAALGLRTALGLAAVNFACILGLQLVIARRICLTKPAS